MAWLFMGNNTSLDSLGQKSQCLLALHVLRILKNHHPDQVGVEGRGAVAVEMDQRIWGWLASASIINSGYLMKKGRTGGMRKMDSDKGVLISLLKCRENLQSKKSILVLIHINKLLSQNKKSSVFTCLTN